MSDFEAVDAGPDEAPDWCVGLVSFVVLLGLPFAGVSALQALLGERVTSADAWLGRGTYLLIAGVTLAVVGVVVGACFVVAAAHAHRDDTRCRT